MEPSSAVKVRIKVYKEALPEDADISTMAIRHLDEKSTDAVNVDTVAEYREDAASDHGTIKPVDGDGKVTELQTVDAENANEETAAIAETAAESKKVLPEEAVAVESTFTVNSFSGFTITFGTQQESSSTKVFFVDANYVEINTNATLNDIGGASTITELDFSKYAADCNNGGTYDYYWNYLLNQYGFNRVELLLHGGTRRPINSKLKKITEGGVTKWQYSYIDGTGENAETKTDFIGDGDEIYVVYDQGINFTTVETVDSDAKGFYLYMRDYNGPADIGDGAYKKDGSITQNVYSSTIGEGKTWPTTVKTRKSLSQWFDDNDASKVNNLFIESVYDETGYYYYNSAEYFATLGTRNYNSTTYSNSFTVYNQLGSPSDENQFYYKRGNFMPYNTLYSYSPWQKNRNLYKDLTLEDDSIVKLSDTDPRYNEALYNFNETANFYFGMYGTAMFYQPVDGKVNGQNMIYEFTGDDDMVVYIDGILVLDLGGIHDAQTGRINFATGDVDYTTTANLNTFVKGHTTIKDQFKAALTKNNGVDNSKTTYDGKKYSDLEWDGNTFKDNSLHRIQFFYMERGAGASNLKLKVNIPTIPKGSVTVQKQVDGLHPEQAKNETYTLQLKTIGRNDEDFTTGVHAYTLSTDTEPHKTDEDGKFSIPGNATATFTDIDDGTEVKVSEELKKGDFYDYQVTYSPSGTSTESGTVTASANGIVNITVKNTTNKAKNLTVEKKFRINGDDSKTEAPNKEDFKPTKFQLKQSVQGTTYENLGDAIPYTEFQNGSHTFENLDPRKTYKVEEIFTTGNKGGNDDSPYSHTTYSVGGGEAVAGTETGEISLQDADKTVTFTNVYEKAKTSIQFTKVEAGTSTSLKDAEFKLYRNQTAAEADFIATAISGQDGVVKFENLPYDNTSGAKTYYYIKETKAPDGYVLSDTGYTAEIDANGKVTITGSGVETLDGRNTAITNTPTKIIFKKMDANDDKKSIEATFKITKDEVALANFGGITDENGCFTINSDGKTLTHLPNGAYELTEITAPGGYNLLTKKISFTITNGQLSGTSENGVVEFDNDGKTVTIYNTAGIQLPETGGMGTLMTTMSGMALMLIALGYLILVKRREKGGLN